MTGKIAHLPAGIQEQLNQRLQNGEEGPTILPWLNALPEVQEILAAKFEGLAISQQNLSEHKRRGFLDWEVRQEALEFATTLSADDCELQKVLPADLADKLSRWVSLRYAAAARSLSKGHSEELDHELQHLRNFSQVILSLRRGELSAGRLAIEQQRLSLELSDTAEAREKDFWEW